MKKNSEPRFYILIAKPILYIFVKFFIRPKIIGLDKIPKKGRIVLAGNHTNNLDSVMLVGIIPRVIHFMAKDSLYKGIKKILFSNMGIIPVNRKIHDKNSLYKAIELLNEDKVIGIFPEGTINRTNNIILPFKIGAVKMAHDTNSQIIPFTIKGKYFSSNLKIEFLDPIKIKDENDLTQENKRLENIIINNLGGE